MKSNLPLGFQFDPSKVIDYLKKKVSGEQLPLNAVIEGEVYGDDARLPEADDIGDREQYMFVKVEKNQNGKKTKRTTKNGHWKVTGNKKEIKDERGNHIGTMRSLVLVERNKSGRKRNLLMDEYTLDGSLKSINSEGWVLCKIKQSKRNTERPYSQEEECLVIAEEDCVDMDDIWASMPDNQAMAECPSETAGEPSHLWPDQSFDQSWTMMETPTPNPTEPPALDYNWGNFYN